jgi:outer membrane protein TolC
MIRRNCISLLLVFILLGHFPVRLSAEEPAYRISLDDATRLALANNFDIQLVKYDAWIARTREKAAGSVYDTIIAAEAGYRKDKKQRATTLLGPNVEDTDYNIGIEKKLPTGTTLNLDMTNNLNETNSPFAVSPTQYESTLGVAIEQPLGRNFFGLQDRGRIKLTRLDIEQSEYTSLERIEQQLADVQKAYLDLVLENERRRIQEGMVEQARALHQFNQEKFKDGLVESPEVLAAEVNYERRRNELRVIENSLRTKANTLRLLLNITDDDIRIEPTEGLQGEEETVGLEAALKSAFENRYDYKRILSDLKSRDIRLVMNRNSIWPEINLVASLNRNGLSTENFSQAIREITEEDHPEFFAGVRFSFPLENNLAEAELEEAQLEKARAILSLKLLERRITIAIIDQLRTYEVFRNVAQRSEEIVRLEEQKLEAELKRFYRGRSDTDTVVRFQEDLLQARLQAAERMFAHRSALVDLYQQESSLLSRYWDAANL